MTQEQSKTENDAAIHQATNYPPLKEVVKLVTEIMESNFLPDIAAKALKGIELKQIGGAPGYCWTCVFQNDKYELDVVYYPSEETWAVCITSRKDRFDSPKLGKHIAFDELKDVIHDTVLKYIF